MMQPTPVAAPAIDPQQQQQQQWMMMPQVPEGGFYPPQSQPQQYSQQVSDDEIRTLWIGDLQFWMDETYLHNCFASTQQLLSLKIMRNKQTRQSEGYGFLEFVSHAAAQMALQNYSGLQMPGTEQLYRLNWAAFGNGDKYSENYSIFVGDLASDVTDFSLQETFRARYPSVKGANVVTDRTTGRSKGYGFVQFGDENEQVRAMTEMNGQFCSTRCMRIGPVTRKNTTGYQQPYPKLVASDDDPNNTTLFVGGLDPTVTEEILMESFGQFGDLVHVKIPLGKHCAFVQFSNRACAEVALQKLHGTFLGQQAIRLSWGRKPANKQVQVQPAGWVQTQQPDPNQWNGDYYGDGQGYGYDPHSQPQDPNNTTLFVGGLDSTVTEEILMQSFGQFGELVHVKIPVGKRCGFVQFSNRACAEVALQNLHGIVLGQQAIRLSWGRSRANKQVQSAGLVQTQQPAGLVQTQQPDPNQWNGTYYGDGQGYGYAPQPQQQPQDPNIYSIPMQQQPQDPNMYSIPMQNLYPPGGYQQQQPQNLYPPGGYQQQQPQPGGYQQQQPQNLYPPGGYQQQQPQDPNMYSIPMQNLYAPGSYQRQQ